MLSVSPQDHERLELGHRIASGDAANQHKISEQVRSEVSVVTSNGEGEKPLRFAWGEMPGDLLRNVVSCWNALHAQVPTSDEPQTHESGMRSPSRLVFHGIGNDFDKALALWAGLMDGTEQGQTWRYVAYQRQRQLSGRQSDFLQHARTAADYFGDNIMQYAGDRGTLMVEFDEEAGEGYVIAIDAGNEGFPLDDQGKLSVDLVQGGFIQSYHGDGIALGRIIGQNDMAIISHGQMIEIPRGSKEPGKLSPRDYDGASPEIVHAMRGSVVLAHWKSNDF